MTLSCNSNQVKKLLKVSLKFCCSPLISALSNHRATKNPRCSILTISLTAAGLSIFCVTRQNASKNRFHYIFINFNNKLLRMSGNFPETFQTFPENLCLVWIWFSFKLCWYPQNLYGQKNFTLAMSTNFFYLWCYTGTVTVVRDKINSRKKQKIDFITKAKKAIWSDWVRDLSGTPECAKSLWIRWRRRISGNGGESWTNGKIG